MKDKSLFERIRNIDALTPSELKIANYLESNYKSLAFDTITQISQGSGVGNATVGRFIHKLGYKDFSDFIGNIRHESILNLESPLQRYNIRRETLSDPQNSILSRHINFAIQNMEETKSHISDKEIVKAAEIMTQAEGSIYVCGGASAKALAMYFQILSKYIRKNIHFLNGDISTLAHQMVDVGDNDVLLAISHKRYSSVTIKAIKWFKKCNSQIITITDRETSPLNKYANVKLVVRSEGPAMFNSRVVTLLLLEALIEAMIFLAEDQVSKRFSIFEELFDDLDTYTKNF